jgi:Tol biopolymer transport system component
MKAIGALNIISVAAIINVSVIPAAAQWTEPQIVEGINFIGTDYYPSISADGTKLYFTSYRSLNEDIYVSEKVGGVWTEPTNLGTPVNSNQRDFGPSISYDGQTLYFVSYGRSGGFGGYDVWYSQWQDSIRSWGEPVNAGPNVNSPGTDWSPSISHDGSKLYFASAWPPRPGHLGGLDLYVSEWDGNGWGPAENLGINTYSDDYCPSISSDDTTLYFASWHHHHLPCWHGPAVDLFVAYYTGGEWTNLANLCDPVSTDAWERCPSISYDGDTLYFASRRDSDFDDIYYSVKTVTGIEEDEDNKQHNLNFDFEIYPNPFNDNTNISISIKDFENIDLSIYNLLGQRIFSKTFFPNRNRCIITWPVGKSHNDYSSGVYFLNIYHNNVDYKAKLLKLK